MNDQNRAERHTCQPCEPLGTLPPWSSHTSRRRPSSAYEELAWRTGEHAVKLSRPIERARARRHHENADYDAAKDEQGKSEARVRQIEQILKDAVVVEGAPGDVVEPGCLVELRYEDDDEPTTYLVGSIEERDDTYDVLSPASPWDRPSSAPPGTAHQPGAAASLGDGRRRPPTRLEPYVTSSYAERRQASGTRRQRDAEVLVERHDVTYIVGIRPVTGVRAHLESAAASDRPAGDGADAFNEPTRTRRPLGLYTSTPCASVMIASTRRGARRPRPRSSIITKFRAACAPGGLVPDTRAASITRDTARCRGRS